MKKVFLFLFLAAACKLYGQSKTQKFIPDTIRISKDSSIKSIENGPLAFLKGCEWEEDMVMAGGKAIDNKQTHISSTVDRAKFLGKRGLYIYNIKQKSLDGTFKLLLPRVILAE